MTVHLLPVPITWVHRALIASQGAQRVQSTGKGVGSLEPEDTAGLDYRVVTRSNMPIRLIEDAEKWNERIGEIVGAGVALATHEGGANVNVLDFRHNSGKPARYEAHLDSDAWTLLVFCTEHDDDGGELQIWGSQRSYNAGDPPAVSITPRIALGVLFDGSIYPHAVAPFTGWHPRVTMPLLYARPGSERDPALDAHLYGKQHS